jgi:hypothetical protein
MASKRTEREWRDLDARYDAIKRQTGWDTAHIGRELGLSRKTLSDRLQRRLKQGTLPDDVNPWAGEGDEPLDTASVQTTVQTSSPVLETSVESSAEIGAEDQHELIPVQTAVQKIDTGPVQNVDTGQVQSSVQLPVQRFEQLEGEVQALAQAVRSIMERMNQTPVQSPVQITTLPPYPKGKSVRWNIWILDSIQDELKSLAAERDVSPSQLVQEILWKALRQA